VIPKITSVLLVAVLVASSSSTLFAEEAAQQKSEMRRVANTAVQKSKQVNVVLRGKRDGKKKLSGMLSNVSDQGLNLSDTKSGQVSQLDFDDIREIRMKPSHVWLVVGVGAAVGLGIALLVGLHAAASNS
jgi:1,4-dihydroxy-2-naphthoyl-CoA synthase